MSQYTKYPAAAGGGGGVSSLNGQTGALTLVAGNDITITPGVGTLTISSTAVPSFTAGSVIFSNGTTLAEDNANFFWDDASHQLLIGDQTALSGDIQAGIRSIYEVTDGPGAVNCGIVTLVDETFTDDAVGGTLGAEFYSRVKVAAGKTVGAIGGVLASVGRQDAADEGLVNFSAGMVASLTQGNSATKVTSEWSSFLAGFSQIDSNPLQVTNFYDFHAMSQSIAAGSVANRYGIYIEPDSGYTKSNWISGVLQVGGTSFSAPTHVLEIDGDTYGAISKTDSSAVAAEFHTTTHTSVSGSNNTDALQLSATSTIDSGATNDKAMTGAILTVTRGDGSDDGSGDYTAGAIALMFHNSGTLGVTTDSVGFDVALIMEQGTITNHYDFRSQRSVIGGTVTNHYGVYIGYDSATPVQNWLAGNTKLGGTSFSSPAVTLDVTGDVVVSGDVSAATLTPANGATGSFTTVDLKTVTVTNGIITSIV